MPFDLSRAISKARDQLPSAFESGSVLPHHDRVHDLVRVGDLKLGTEDGLTADRAGDVSEAIKALGFEAMAFYISFHRPTVAGRWGIFYFEGRMRQFAAMIRHRLGLAADDALAVAFEIVRRHEHFHFQFDLYSLHQELTMMRPLYNAYHSSAYRNVFCTEVCFEEALANRALTCRADWDRFASLRPDWPPPSVPSRVYRAYVARSLGRTLGAPPSAGLASGPGAPASVARSARGASKRPGRNRALSLMVADFVRELCIGGPPGYCNFADPHDKLRSGLGGQLLHSSPSGRLAGPQFRWVGFAQPFARGSCPESVLESGRSAAGKSFD